VADDVNLVHPQHFPSSSNPDSFCRGSGYRAVAGGGSFLRR
jgi:hypothetical protein